MKYYQMVCRGSMAIFDGEGRFSSRDIYKSKDQITEKIKSDFIIRCCTPLSDHDLLYLENNSMIKIDIVGLESVE